MEDRSVDFGIGGSCFARLPNIALPGELLFGKQEDRHSNYRGIVQQRPLIKKKADMIKWATALEADGINTAGEETR